MKHGNFLTTVAASRILFAIPSIMNSSVSLQPTVRGLCGAKPLQALVGHIY